jgi:signal transduction histidine kinase
MEFLIKDLNVHLLGKIFIYYLYYHDYSDNFNLKRSFSVIVEQMNNQNFILKNDFYSFFIKIISKVPGIDDFIYLGEKTILNQNICTNYEVFCRYTQFRTGDEFEIILNYKTIKNSNRKELSQSKNKELCLSKISHEIKNPLICISELINQINERFSNRICEDKDIINNFTTIQSLSNFVQILIKDLNHFSECQGENTLMINKKETDVFDVVSFCENIVNVLLKKANKNERIKFIKYIDDQVPEKIITDEWRLKQVLVNLLSNSAKFTHYGKVGLEISPVKIENQNYIKFLVYDTGVGMKQGTLNYIFQPFNKDLTNKNNELGSGLGLCLCKDITSKLGSELNFYTKEGEGTSFWFHIPVLKKTSSKSISLKSQKIQEKDDKYKFVNYLVDENEKNNEKNSNNELFSFSSLDVDEDCNSVKTKQDHTLPYFGTNISNLILNVNLFDPNSSIKRKNSNIYEQVYNFGNNEISAVKNINFNMIFF